MKFEIPDPPAWFSDFDYAVIGNLDAVGWCGVLDEMLQQELDIIDGDLPSHPDFHAEWWTRRQEGRFYQPVWPRGAGTINRPPLRELAEHEGRKPQPDFLPHLEIALHCPDGVLIDAFKRWLIEKRRVTPGPKLSAPGRSPQEKKRFGQHEFDKWIVNRIVELSDLEYWAWCTGTTTTNGILGYWLYPDPYGTKGWDHFARVTAAREVRREALEDLAALREQAKFEAGCV